MCNADALPLIVTFIMMYLNPLAVFMNVHFFIAQIFQFVLIA